MSHPQDNWTEHTESHNGFFNPNCDYCDIAKEFGIWQGGEFYTFKEINEKMEKSNDGEQL
jgi:hypothetical protein